MEKNNAFFNQVYELVARIPPGRVMTYGQIARVLESAYSAKIVGYAMSRAPEVLDLPCHRVVNRLGEMAKGPMFGGEDSQRAKLKKEGVKFKRDGRINLEKSLFQP